MYGVLELPVDETRGNSDKSVVVDDDRVDAREVVEDEARGAEDGVDGGLGSGRSRACSASNASSAEEKRFSWWGSIIFPRYSLKREEILT